MVLAHCVGDEVATDLVARDCGSRPTDQSKSQRRDARAVEGQRAEIKPDSGRVAPRSAEFDGRQSSSTLLVFISIQLALAMTDDQPERRSVVWLHQTICAIGLAKPGNGARQTADVEPMGPEEEAPNPAMASMSRA